MVQTSLVRVCRRSDEIDCSVTLRVSREDWVVENDRLGLRAEKADLKLVPELRGIRDRLIFPPTLIADTD